MNNIFCYRRIIFHFALSQGTFFPGHKVIILSCDTKCTSRKRMCSSSCNEYSPYVYKRYFSCHKNYFSCEREQFSHGVWVVLGVSHLRDKCVGYTIKISYETLRFPGSLVPRDSPALVILALTLYLVVILLGYQAWRHIFVVLLYY